MDIPVKEYLKSQNLDDKLTSWKDLEQVAANLDTTLFKDIGDQVISIIAIDKGWIPEELDQAHKCLKSLIADADEDDRDQLELMVSECTEDDVDVTLEDVLNMNQFLLLIEDPKLEFVLQLFTDRVLELLSEVIDPESLNEEAINHLMETAAEVAEYETDD